MALIELNSGKDQILFNRKLLNTVAVVAFVASLFLWSVAPFIPSSNSNRDKFVRYLSLICTILGGDILLACGRKLERNQPLYKALEKAQENVFIHQVATSQYAYEQEITQAAQSTSQDLQQSLPVTSATSTLEVSEANGSEDFPTSTSTSATSEQLDLEVIREAVSAGKSDSWIIENLLKMGGRKFAEGQALLKEIKLVVGN